MNLPKPLCLRWMLRDLDCEKTITESANGFGDYGKSNSAMEKMIQACDCLFEFSPVNQSGSDLTALHIAAADCLANHFCNRRT